MRTMLALLLATAAAAADDPPFVVAARERQAKAKAFEVTLTVRKEWKGVTPIGSKERKDFAGTDTARLVVDGERFWYEVDGERLTGMANGMTRSHQEMAFDCAQIFTRYGSVRVNGPQAGQLEYTQGVSSPDGSVGWPDDIVAPLRWVFRGASPGSPLAALSERGDNLGLRQTVRPTGRYEVVGGTRCAEVEREIVGPDSTPKQTFWLDPEVGYLPKRIGDTTVEYAQHPTLGRVPSRWRITPASRFGYLPTSTTVTVDSFELRDSIPDHRFALTFPVGSRVVDMRKSPKGVVTLVVAEDGSLVPEEKKEPPSAAIPTPEPPKRSLQHSLWVVGGMMAVFVALVVLLRRLARNRTDDSPDSGTSPPLLS
ncbi:MAG: hypothetical protein ABGY75_23145 [Gemmataceae bacterium]